MFVMFGDTNVPHVTYKSNISCVIVDDNPSAIKEIADILSRLPNVSILSTFTSPLDAFSFLKASKDRIDLLFTDIEMPYMSGLELADLVKAKIKHVIFTTSHAEFALKAFDILADGYLLKPFSVGKFLQVLDKVSPQLLTEKKKNYKVENDFIVVKSKEDRGKLIKVFYDEIVAIESLLNYVRIHTLRGKIITHISLKDIKEFFSGRNEFRQLHRSFVIAENHISSVEGNTLLMTNGAKFTVGVSYREELSDFFLNKLLKPIL